MSGSQKHIEVVALALLQRGSGKYLLARRGPGGSGAGEWEFPGGKIEPGETQRQALVREIREELSLDLTGLTCVPVAENVHAYPQKTVRIFLWLAEVDFSPVLTLTDHDETGFFTLDEMPALGLSAGDKAFVSQLKSYSRK